MASPFAALGLGARLVEALQELGYEEPTPIQREAIPPLCAGRDVLGQAATGTGKTAAFALPLLQRLYDRAKPKGTSILVLVPTRELAIQVAEATHRYGRALGMAVLPIYELPEQRQTAFSATMPKRIAAIAARHLKDPVTISIKTKFAVDAVPLVRQIAYVVPRAHQAHDARPRARHGDADVGDHLLPHAHRRRRAERGDEQPRYRAEALHGGLSQAQRDRVMKRFREQAVELIIATDVAARGLDIKHLSHVFNYDVPSAPEAYVHRIGRTGRAGREGVAIILAEPRELRQEYRKNKRPSSSKGTVRMELCVVNHASSRSRVGKLSSYSSARGAKFRGFCLWPAAGKSLPVLAGIASRKRKAAPGLSRMM